MDWCSWGCSHQMERGLPQCPPTVWLWDAEKGEPTGVTLECFIHLIPILINFSFSWKYEQVLLQIFDCNAAGHYLCTISLLYA